MLTEWISPEALAALNDGFVVAIMLEAKEGQSDALAEILRVLTPPTMAEPGVKLSFPIARRQIGACSLSLNFTSTKRRGVPMKPPTTLKPR